jgi:LPXTG-motif cell wall-anchored protein
MRKFGKETGRKVVVKKHSKNFFMLFVLVFAFISGSFQTSIYAAEQTQEETITVVGDKGVLLEETSININEKITAFDVLRNTVGVNNLEFSESTYGKMITGIKGLQAKGNYYWAFYVNGISAQVGADQYIVQKGDRLSFKYVDWTVASENRVSIKIVGDKGILKEVENISFIDKPTAFQLLQAVLGNQLEFSESEYGKMITSINGVKMEGTNYWAFYVNGQMAALGADKYQLKANDLISFQYESWETPGEDPEEGTEDETTPEPTTPQVAPISDTKLSNAINAGSNYVVKNQVGEWEAVALKQSGKEIPANYLENVTKLIKDKKGKFSRITDYERYTIGILAAGGNPTNVAGYNLIEAIYNGNVTKQGLNGVFYGLIALDSASFEIPENAKWTREKLVAHLLENQNDDHGWSWDGSKKSDIDTTAMVLTALAPYKDDTIVKKAIEVAVQYLSSQYQTTKIDNSSTAAQVVVALSSIGVDANDPLFTKEGISLISYLLSFQNADGGFDWQGGDSSDVMSTSQGIQGVVAYHLFINKLGGLYQLPLHSETPPEEVPNDENNDGITPEPNNDSSEGEEGLPLPNTASNTYNYLLIGIVLLMMGACLFIIEKRKKA